MRVLFLTPYYPPELGAPQARIYELALRLEKLGHEVSVLTTFPNYPSGIVPQEWRGKFFWHGIDQGIRVYRIWSFATPNKGFYKRILSQLSFTVLAALAGALLPSVDVIVVESPPLFDGFAGMFLSAVKRAPYVFNVADLWPDAAIEMGMLNNPTLIRLAKAMELFFYRHAALILAVTAGVRQAIVGKGIAAGKVALFRNAVDARFFSPRPGTSEVRRQCGVAESDFVVMYAGTLGLGQQLDAIIDAAGIFQQEGDRAVKFLLFGDGAERETLEHKAQQLRLENLRFLGLQPKARMPELLSAADCVLVSIRDVPALHSALPTKMFEAMACARPVVLVARGEAAEVLSEAGAGVCALPGNPASIRDAIRQVRQDPGKACVMGQRGREYAALHFNRDQRAHELSEMLEKLLPATAKVKPVLRHPVPDKQEVSQRGS
jgi:putative colanic acid biosynthesis glycosyltransferase WcaI